PTAQPVPLPLCPSLLTCAPPHLHLHSLPTRRSSDLTPVASANVASMRGLRSTDRGGPNVTQPGSASKAVSCCLSGFKCISHPSHNRGHLFGLASSWITPGTQAGGSSVEHTDQIVDDGCHILSLWSGGAHH